MFLLKIVTLIGLKLIGGSLISRALYSSQSKSQPALAAPFCKSFKYPFSNKLQLKLLSCYVESTAHGVFFSPIVLRRAIPSVSFANALSAI